MDFGGISSREVRSMLTLSNDEYAANDERIELFSRSIHLNWDSEKLVVQGTVISPSICYQSSNMKSELDRDLEVMRRENRI